MKTHAAQFYCESEKAIRKGSNSFRTVYQVDCLDGHGQMTVFQVFPGAELIYDEFDATNCFCGIQASDNIMEINHCLEGRSECELQNGSYRYLGEGDLSVNVLCNHTMKMGFPLKHYRGINIVFYLDEFIATIPQILPDKSIDIGKLREKLCPNNECFIMRAKDKIEHIFLDLYTVPVSIQKPYFRLKVLELLLYFNILSVSESREQREYYPRQQVETIKRIRNQITEQPGQRYTIEELSNEYGISRTALKSCFKGIYGTSIGAYIKTFRMQYAAILLRNSCRSVSDIAASAGYENQSRFAAAFKEIIGASPLKYRKK